MNAYGFASYPLFQAKKAKLAGVVTLHGTDTHKLKELTTTEATNVNQ
jgi:hypothetical protein